MKKLLTYGAAALVTVALTACTVEVQSDEPNRSNTGGLSEPDGSVPGSNEDACASLEQALDVRPNSNRWNDLVFDAWWLSESGSAFEDALNRAYWTLDAEAAGAKAQQAYGTYC